MTLVFNQRGEREFAGTKDDWDAAARLAENCNDFMADDDEEMISDQLRSCFNCRFRRWTQTSFVCRVGFTG